MRDDTPPLKKVNFRTPILQGPPKVPFRTSDSEKVIPTEKSLIYEIQDMMDAHSKNSCALLDRLEATLDKHHERLVKLLKKNQKG